MTLVNAKDTTLSALKSLPNVNSTILGWFQDVSFTLITKTIVDFVLQEVEVTSSFYGVRQPFSPQELKLKPEGQRAWNWEMIHSSPDLILKIDDRIAFDGIKYRVMKKNDYKEYGYVEYHICQDYEG